MMKEPRVTLDFETRGKIDLKKVGAYKYSLDPLTRPTCLAVKRHGKPVVLVPFDLIYLPWKKIPESFRFLWRTLIAEGYLFVAHNAFFERCIYENILVFRLGWPEIDPRRWRCTLAKAAACGLPRGLEKCADALDLEVRKDRRGYSAMMATCKPTRAWKAWNDRHEKIRTGKKVTRKTFELAIHTAEPQMFLEPENAPQVFETLYDYCKTDVVVEETLDDTLPDLSEDEQEIWFLNQCLNWRGLRVDVPTVRKVVDIMADESKMKLKELDSLTMGLVTKPGARRSILEFLALEGIELPDLRAKTVDDKLQGFDLSDDMKRLLELRKALSLTSTRKYHGFLDRASEDDRVRDLLLYHGGHTGRDSGTGIQPQNFPKGVISIDKDRPYAAVENVVECEPEMLRLLYGDSLAMLFSSILRNMIIPSEGFELFVGDFSLIEVAVCWWLAGNLPGLKVIESGMDPYRYMAMANTGKEYIQIQEGTERQLGKAQVLGCGFGMGWEKFKKTAREMFRVSLSDEQSKVAVENYRRTNPTVPELWKAYENAAIAAVETGSGKRGVFYVDAGWCRFFMKDKFLVVQLPSGRCIRYREPQISWRESDYGARKTLEFYGVNPKTKKWGIERTWGGVLTNNITQGVARDLLMPALLRLEKAGYRALLTVHDEGIAERRIGRGSVEEFLKIMCEQPAWAPGLPIRAKGWKGPRYRK